MPFNAANPADNEKIRRLGIVIRPNWEAIEEGSQDDANPNKLKYWSLNLFSRDDIPSAPGDDAQDVEDGIAIFSKTDSDTGQPEIFTTHEDATVTQLTKGPANIAPIGFANNGETSIYGGLLLKYGVSSVAGNSSATITFTDVGLTAFPNSIFNIQATPIDSVTNPSFAVNTPTTTSFVIKNSSGARQYYWMAIGN